jgi:hypothetical protein
MEGMGGMGCRDTIKLVYAIYVHEWGAVHEAFQQQSGRINMEGTENIKRAHYYDVKIMVCSQSITFC